VKVVGLPDPRPLLIMAKKPETRLQRRIQKALKEAFPGSWWFKVHGGPFQKAGVPDLIGCVAGLFFALEVKMPDEEPTKLQVLTMRKIREAGGISTTVETPEEAVAIVRAALAGPSS